MARLTTKQRKKLKSTTFALPGRKYPLDTKNRARNALARISQFGTPAQKATVRRKVKAKFPGIAVGGKKSTRAKRASNGKR